MSTRAQVIVNTTQTNRPIALYKHHDGYPQEGLGQWLLSALKVSKFNLLESFSIIGGLEFENSTEIHGDIEYLYYITDYRLRIYQVKGGNPFTNYKELLETNWAYLLHDFRFDFSEPSDKWVLDYHGNGFLVGVEMRGWYDGLAYYIDEKGNRYSLKAKLPLEEDEACLYGDIYKYKEVKPYEFEKEFVKKDE